MKNLNKAVYITFTTILFIVSICAYFLGRNNNPDPVVQIVYKTQEEINTMGTLDYKPVKEIKNLYDIPVTTDGSSVFLYGTKMEGLDSSTTRVFAHNVIADKNSVYYLEGLSIKKIEGLKPENLRVVTYEPSIVLANDTQVYTSIYHGSFSGRFTYVVSDPSKLRYIINQDKVSALTDDVGLYLNTEQYFIRLPITSPKILYYSLYIKGDDYVYYDTKRIDGADAKSFQLLNEHFPVEEDTSVRFGAFYAKDNNHVYYKGDVVIGANPKTFKVYKARYYEEYAYDDKHVYLNGEAIDEADPNTFVVLKTQPYEGCRFGYYSKDAYNVYYMTQKIKGVEPSTFQILYNGYAKDASHSYYEGMVIDIHPNELNVVCYYG